ncbi:MAG: hypothetical protein ACFE85_15990 [Candidatus Hodarchaeota archaeon]
MSYGKLKSSENFEDLYSNLVFDSSKAVISYSEFFKKQIRQDIYVGNENIPFNKKHPIFKSLMRVEFEDAMKEFLKIE